MAALTFGDARNRYLQDASLRSPHTIDAYRRAIELFFAFLVDRSGNPLLPIQQGHFVLPEEVPLSALSSDDVSVFYDFAEWLLSSGSGQSGDKRPYKASTVELRLAGIQNWFEFMHNHGWLPVDFPLVQAKSLLRDKLHLQLTHSGRLPQPDDVGKVVYYYDTQEMPSTLRKPDIDADRIRLWELTRLRNRALLHILADTGGRISEVLSLNLSDFEERGKLQNDILLVEVQGKGGHTYSLRFREAIPAVLAYIHSRGILTQEKTALFVSHDPRYDGQRMSRIVAWRVVHRAAHALGLHDITPHDFRHWRAAQLLQAGHTLDEVQDYLGHRSVETTRIYYASPNPE